MLNINSQVQDIEFQLSNIKASFETISLQSQNFGIQNFPSQIQYLGIQMINI